MLGCECNPTLDCGACGVYFALVVPVDVYLDLISDFLWLNVCQPLQALERRHCDSDAKVNYARYRKDEDDSSPSVDWNEAGKCQIYNPTCINTLVLTIMSKDAITSLII